MLYFSRCQKPTENVKSFLHLGHSFTSEFNDDEGIINGRSNFVHHTNNSLCYFQKLHPFVQNRLFQAYCTSLYGCKLRSLTNCNIETLCVAWKKLSVEFGPCRLVRIVVYYPLFLIVCHYSMRFVVDHFILMARVLFTIRL